MQFLKMLMGHNKIKIFSLNSLTMRGQNILVLTLATDHILMQPQALSKRELGAALKCDQLPVGAYMELLLNVFFSIIYNSKSYPIWMILLLINIEITTAAVRERKTEINTCATLSMLLVVTNVTVTRHILKLLILNGAKLLFSDSH